MFDREELRRYIVTNEGWRTRVYNDSLGIPTIGVGFNLNRRDANQRITELGLNYEQVLSGEQELSVEQVNQLLDGDLDSSISTVQNLFPNFSQFSSGRQIVLIDLAFNLGANRLSSFTRMIAAINAGNWTQASVELANSRYYTQVGRRGRWNSTSLAQGELTNFEPHKPKEAKEGSDGSEGSEGKEGSEGSEGKEGSEGTEGSEGKEDKDRKEGKDHSEGSEGKEGTEGSEGKEGSEGSEGTEGSEGKESSEGKEGGTEGSESKESLDFAKINVDDKVIDNYNSNYSLVNKIWVNSSI
jgi:GH24 family phage-related lysozyme (muramidase)